MLRYGMLRTGLIQDNKDTRRRMRAARKDIFHCRKAQSARKDGDS
jgi:hypothetical protein